MSPLNEAAWILKPRGDLKRFTAAYNAPLEGEIVIEVHHQQFAWNVTAEAV